MFVLITIRNDESLSQKAGFIVQLLERNLDVKVFSVFKKESAKFGEEWKHDQVQLSSSTKGLIMYYSLMVFKSPKELATGLMARLSLGNRKHVLAEQGLLTVLSRTLYLCYGTSGRPNNLMDLLNRLASPKIFLIDEFLSLNILNLKKLKLFGPIIYVSQDIAYNRFGFGDNSITKKMMFKLEKDAIANSDLVVACSEMERLKYLEMGAKNAIFYPNIYPLREFEPSSKDEMPTICIVLKAHWGHKAEKYMEEILTAIESYRKQIKVYMIGIRPPKIPKNVTMIHASFIKTKLDYLKVLSKSWVGINIGIHKAGTNERKYDYAEAGTVVLSDTLGARGDLLPHEYTYVDYQDLAAKIGQLVAFGKANLTEMGKRNRSHVLNLAEKERQKVLDNITNIALGACRDKPPS